MDFNIIIQIITTDPKNETTIADEKAKVVRTVIKEADDGFVQRLKVSKVIPKSKLAIIILVFYKFCFPLSSGMDIIFSATLR